MLHRVLVTSYSISVATTL